MSKKMWIGIAAALVIVVAVLVWVTGKQAGNIQNPNVIMIGAISPFTGEGANYGKVARTGIDMAVDEINAQGGIRGAKLAVKYEDDKGSATDALTAFNKLATIDKVPAVLGPFYSGNVLAVAPEAERRRVVVLSGSATSDNITKAGEYIFRTCPSNVAQARTIADYAYKNLNLKTSFVLYRNVEYGVTLRDAFDKAFKTVGGKVVGVEAVPADATDVRAQLAKVKAANPPFIFAAVHYAEGGVLLRQAKELGITSTIIGTDGGYDPQLLKIAGSAADGSYWVTIGWGDTTSNPMVSGFIDRYRKRYGEEPGSYSGLYYDAAHVLAVAMAAATKIDGPELQRALLSAQFTGPTGVTRFDAFGDVDKPFAVYRIEAGKFIPVGAKK